MGIAEVANVGRVVAIAGSCCCGKHNTGNGANPLSPATDAGLASLTGRQYANKVYPKVIARSSAR